jgi:hypothetical protein
LQQEQKSLAICTARTSNLSGHQERFMAKSYASVVESFPPETATRIRSPSAIME